MPHTLQKIDTPQAPKALGPYSQAISDGQYVFVSGQLPIDPVTGKLVEGDIQKSVSQVLENMEAVLKAGGSDISHVMRVDIFLKDLNHFALVNAAYAKKFVSATPPARQTVEVARLPMDAPVEMSCIAKIISK